MSRTISRNRMWMRAVATAVACLFFLNTIAWSLAPEGRLSRAEFQEKFSEGYSLLAHAAANEHIAERIRDAGGFKNLRQRPDSVNIVNMDEIREQEIIIAAIPDLFAERGQFAHVGLVGKDDNGVPIPGGRPVIYVDDMFFYDESKLADAKEHVREEGRDAQKAKVDELYESGKITVSSKEGEEFVFELEVQDGETFVICAKKDNRTAGVIYVRGNTISYSFKSDLMDRRGQHEAIEVMPGYEERYTGIGRTLMSLAMGISKYKYGHEEFVAQDVGEVGFYASLDFTCEAGDAVFDLAGRPLPEIHVRRKTAADVILEHEKDEVVEWADLIQGHRFGPVVPPSEFREKYITGSSVVKGFAEIAHDNSRGTSRLHDMFEENKHRLNRDSLWDAYRRHGFDEDDDDVNIAAGAGEGIEIRMRATARISQMITRGGWSAILNAVSNERVAQYVREMNGGKDPFIPSSIDIRLFTIHEKVEILARDMGCSFAVAHSIALYFEKLFRDFIYPYASEALELPSAGGAESQDGEIIAIDAEETDNVRVENEHTGPRVLRSRFQLSKKALETIHPGEAQPEETIASIKTRREYTSRGEVNLVLTIVKTASGETVGYVARDGEATYEKDGEDRVDGWEFLKQMGLIVSMEEHNCFKSYIARYKKLLVQISDSTSEQDRALLCEAMKQEYLLPLAKLEAFKAQIKRFLSDQERIEIAIWFLFGIDNNNIIERFNREIRLARSRRSSEQHNNAPKQRYMQLPPNGSPADCLETIRDDEGLLRLALNPAMGISTDLVHVLKRNNPKTGQPYHIDTVREEFRILRALGILVDAEGRRNRYRFADFMIGEDENFTKTLINAVNDIHHQVGIKGNPRPLHRGSIPEDEMDTVRELVTATILHQVNLMQKLRSTEEGVEEVYFSEGYLAFVESRLLHMGNLEESVRGVIRVLRSGLKDREDHWFYTRLIRLAGIPDERPTAAQGDRYYGQVQFTKNARKLEKVLNSVTPVYAFNTDDTLDRGRTSLSTESANRLAALIANGRKIQITTGKSLEELGEFAGQDGLSVELYAELRRAVIEKVREEAWDDSVMVADELLSELFEMILDTGATRLYPMGSAESQNELTADTAFQRSIPAELASRIEEKLVGDGIDEELARVIAAEKQRLVSEGYHEYESQEPVLRFYGMKPRDGGRVITKIKYQPFGDVIYDRVGNPEKYSSTMKARARVAEELEKIIKEMIPEEERREGVSLLPVAAGSSSVDLNLISEGKAIQKDRGVLHQQALGHTEVNYFDNTAFSGNGQVVTQLRQRLEYEQIEGFRLNVFAVDINLPEGVSPQLLKGVTYLGKSFTGTAEELDRVIKRIEGSKPSVLEEEAEEAHIQFSGEYLSKIRQRAKSLGLRDGTLDIMMGVLDEGITNDAEHWFYSQMVKIFGISDKRIPSDGLVVFQGFKMTEEDSAYEDLIRSVKREVKIANSTEAVTTSDASIFNFSTPYLRVIEELLEANGTRPHITESIMSILKMGLCDDQDHWFYSRLIRRLGLFDMRQSVDGQKKYYGRAELTKHDGYLQRLINGVTTVYSFDKDDTLDEAQTSLRGVTAEKLAALIANGRKVAINTAKVIDELVRAKERHTGRPLEIYKPLRDAVIDEMKKEGWGSLSETVADDLLCDLCVLYLGTGISRMLPAHGVENQAGLVPDADFQRGFTEEVAARIESKLVRGDSMDSELEEVLEYERRKLVEMGYAEYENQDPNINIYYIDMPDGQKIITKVNYQPFGRVRFSKEDKPRHEATIEAREAVKVVLDRIFREIGLNRDNPEGDYAILTVVAGTSSIDFNMIYRGERIQKDRAIRYEFGQGHKRIRYFDDEAFRGNAKSVTEYCQLLQAKCWDIDFQIFAVDGKIPPSVIIEEIEGVHSFRKREQTGEYLDEVLRDIEAAKPSVIKEDAPARTFSGEATIAPEKRVVCHIVSGEIIPEGQKQIVQELQQRMRRSGYKEKIVRLDPEVNEDFVSMLQRVMEAQKEYYRRQGYSVEFDVAVHDASLVPAVQELGIDVLAFERPEGDFAQLEAIILALRALKTQRIEVLRKVYEFISGEKLNEDQMKIEDIEEFAREISFILPSAAIGDLQEIQKLNAALKKFILSAA